MPVQVHQKFANIVIRRQLELASSASTLTKTQDTLESGQTASKMQMGFFAGSIGPFEPAARTGRVKLKGAMLRLLTRDNVGKCRSRHLHFPKAVAILVQLIFLTPDWTKLPNSLGLEKCLYYTWLQFTENGTSSIFTMKMKQSVGDLNVAISQ